MTTLKGRMTTLEAMTTLKTASGGFRMSAWVGRFSAGAMAVALLLAAGCSQSTAPSGEGAGAAAAPAGPPQTIAAKTAFGKIYPSPRAWAAGAEFLTGKQIGRAS